MATANGRATLTIYSIAVLAAGFSHYSDPDNWIGEHAPIHSRPERLCSLSGGRGASSLNWRRNPAPKEMRSNRSEFKNRVEDFLRDAFGAFTKGEVGKVNERPREKHFLAWHWEETIEISLDLHLYDLFEEATGDFDPRQRVLGDPSQSFCPS